MKISEINKIYNVLSGNKTKYFTVKSLARTAKVNQENVHKRIYDLRNEGYVINKKYDSGVFKYQMA